MTAGGRYNAGKFRHAALLCLAVISALVLIACCPGPVAAQVGSTILPTDVEPLPGAKNNRPFSNTLQLRLWQFLPSPLYFNGSAEATFRIETNPYQYPLKRTLLHQNLPPGTNFNSLSNQDKIQLLSDLAEVSSFDNVQRITPNGTIGWALTPNTQVFANSFLIRDTLLRNYPLNTTTGAVGFGLQHMFNLTGRTSLQAQYMGRELWQSQQVPVFDHLPNLTWQYNVTDNFILYANALLQLRFAHFIGSYMREIDPFYTWGFSWQRGSWTFSASSTLVQDFRKQFHSQAIIPQNNYTVICDFEIDHPLVSQFPGLVALVRAEPVYNFHSNATPGLAGMDFRLYYGVRLQIAKPALNQTIEQLRRRYGPPGTPAQSSWINRAVRQALICENKPQAAMPIGERQEGTEQQGLQSVAYSYATIHGAMPESEGNGLSGSGPGISQHHYHSSSLQDVLDQRSIRLAL